MGEENKETAEAAMTPEELLAKQEAEEKALEEKKRQEEEAKKAAEEQKAKEEAARKEAQRKAEEERKEAEAAKKAAEEKAKREAEEKARKEAEAKARAEAEAKAKAEAEAKAKKEAEEKAAAEAAAKAKAEEEAKKAAEAKKVDLDKPAAPKVVIVRPGWAKPAAPQISEARKRVVNAIKNEVSEDMHMHTAAGRALIRKFTEYTALCKSARRDNAADMSKCAHKLYEIVLECCPRQGNKNAAYYRELIMIVFKRLSDGYGTLFSDKTLFRADYNLPSATDSMKFDAFWSAMYQLVEASKTGARITFNSKTLGNILKSPSAMAVINQIRSRLDSVRD